MVGSVRLKYYTDWGRQETIKIGLKEEYLDLSARRITSIDLTPLQYCSEIRFLNLSNNYLKQIDLNPLCTFQNFFEINLSENSLEMLNVTPLLFCNNLTRLIGCDKLDYIIDPIGQYALGNYAILQSASKLNLSESYDELVQTHNWRSILLHTKELLRLLPPRHWFAAQRGLLTGLGFPDIAAYDGNPNHLLEKIPPEMEFERAKIEIQDIAINLLKQQIESGGSTHFLDIEDLASSPAAILIDPIIENRKKEMEELKIERVNGKVDGRIFYFTNYGRQILNKMGYRPTASNAIRLADILEVMKKTGFEPKIVDMVSEPKKYAWERFSQGLIDFLEHFARGSSFVIDIVRGTW